MAREVARARCALGPDCEVLQADIRSAPFGSADAVVILDVLHYLPAQSQPEVLQRVRAALPPGGLLLLRVGDAGGGVRLRFTQWVDKLMLLARGQRALTLHCRSIEHWRELLHQCGLRDTLRQCAADRARDLTGSAAQVPGAPGAHSAGSAP